jgi:hypothetical protein
MLDAYTACLCADTGFGNGGTGYVAALNLLPKRFSCLAGSHETVASSPPCMASTPISAGGGSAARAQDKLAEVDGSDFAALPVPELLVWVRDSVCTLPPGRAPTAAGGGASHPEAHAALLRCLGQIAASAGGFASARRRLLATVVAEGPVGMMAEAAYGAGGDPTGPPPAHHPTVVATGAVALWAAMHGSEQARAAARALLASAAVSVPVPPVPYGGGTGMGTTARARHAIALMLQ